MGVPDFRINRLVSEAKSGDGDAFDTLLRMVEADLKKIAVHFFILGSDREDVLQELRIGVWKAVQSYDETKDSSFRGFSVNLVCKRHLATAISAAKRYKNSPLNNSVSLDAPIIIGNDGNMQTLAEVIPDRHNALEDCADRDMLDELVQREEYDKNATLLLQRLTPLERDIFHAFGHDSSYKDIAELLGVPPKCVDNALMRIRKKAVAVYGHYVSNEEDTSESEEVVEQEEPVKKKTRAKNKDGLDIRAIRKNLSKAFAQLEPEMEQIQPNYLSRN